MSGFLADLVVLCHLGFIVFAVGGGLLVAWRPAVAWVHIPVVAWAAAIEFAGWICPLTPLESWLRARAERSVYAGGFIDHYVLPVIYPVGLTPEMQWVLGGLVLVVNACVYAWVVHRWRRERARRPSLPPTHGVGGV